MNFRCELAAGLGLLLLAACTPAPVVPQSPLGTVVPESTEEARALATQDEVVARAVAHLAAHLNVPSSEIKVHEVRVVRWRDGSLGCPQPGEGSQPAEAAGLLILLRHNGATYQYHSGETQEPFLCEPSSVIVPTPADSKQDEMVPPPDSEID